MSKNLVLTNTGGFPFEQDTLAFMQAAKEEILDLLKAHFGVSGNQGVIISGLTLLPSPPFQAFEYTEGWIFWNGELLKVNGGVGTYIKLQTNTITVTHEDNSTHSNYIHKYGEIVDSNSSGTTIQIATMQRRHVNADLISKYDAATEALKGIAEIATQTETNAGVDDSRIVTPKKLKAASFLPIIHAGGTIFQTQQWNTTSLYTITFPDYGDTSYFLSYYINWQQNFPVPVIKTCVLKKNTDSAIIAVELPDNNGSSSSVSFQIEYLILKR